MTVNDRSASQSTSPFTEIRIKPDSTAYPAIPRKGYGV
jgi:hypothetical protein